MMGNHYHLVARFPKQNRAPFMRDFNSAVARLVGRYIGEHGRRSVWARRYSYQILPTPEDVKHWFFYVGLNPVSSGLVTRIEDYPSFNSFPDAVSGNNREYEWLDWNAYFKSRRHNRHVSESEFIRKYTLRFSRLSDSHQLAQQDYQVALTKELESRRRELVAQRKTAGKTFLGARRLKQQNLGSKPYATKTSSRYSFRPIVLSLCAIVKRATLDIYFGVLSAFQQASSRFTACLSDHLPFPSGTYPPPHVRCV